MSVNDELHIHLGDEKPPLEPVVDIVQPLTGPARVAEPESQRVYRRMTEVIDIIGPSRVSSHHKGETLALLRRLRDEEVLRLVEKESIRFMQGGQ